MPTSSGRRSAPRFSLAAPRTFAIVALLVAGCTSGIDTKSETEARQPPHSATEVLERVKEAYHKADRYQDDGRLLVRYRHDCEIVDETSEFSLAMAGPNRLRMRAYHALVVCDGQTFRATIDEAPGEVLSFPAPDELSPPSIYKDTVLEKSLNQIVGSVPLWLFLEPDPVPGLLFNGQAPQLDSPESIGPDLCYRVRIDRREGAFVLWIDQQTFVVRRVEYPSGGYRRLLEPYIGDITDMTITAELDGARLDPPIDDAKFQFDLPRGAELVKRFDSLRPGARIPKFKLRALDGHLITRESLADKIAVLKFWTKDGVFKNYKDLASFQQVQRQYQSQDSIVFLTVCADADDVTDDDLRAVFAKAELSLPIARITRQAAIRSFGLQMAPATVILGRDGSLQEHVIGAYPNQATALPGKLDMLLAGNDLTLEAPQQAPNVLFYSGFGWQNADEPEKQPQPIIAPPLAKAGIAPSSAPELLRAKRLWTCSELRQPGNILVLPDRADSDKVFIVEGLPSVVEIGAEGKLLAKHRLELPDRDDAAVTFLRSGVDGAGNRYFLGSKAGAQQVHLFDAHWKRLLSFPETGDHPGIADAILADLQGAGDLKMYVGYLQAVGVHCVALDGQRLWRNRAAENVFQLGVTGPDRQNQRQLLVAQGWVLPIDDAGRERAPIVLPDALVRLIFTADLDGDQQTEYCAIAAQWLGPGEAVRNLAVGLSPRGQERWRYQLPEGTHQHASLEMVVAGNLLGDEIKQWVIAAADGSIHILDSDGSLIDRFNSGVAPSGIAIAKLGGQPALLIATDEGLEAWQFEAPPAAPAEGQ